MAIDPSKAPLDYRDPKADVRPGPTATRILAWVIGSLAALMLLGSILIPSLGRARETAQRVKCASNLKQIGQALLLYANENRGQPAPDWPTLLSTQALVPEVFICPSSDLHKATGATPAQVNAELLEGEHL